MRSFVVTFSLVVTCLYGGLSLRMSALAQDRDIENALGDLRGGVEEQRISAVKQMGKIAKSIGPERKGEITSALEDALTDSSASVRCLSVQALSEFAGAEQKAEGGLFDHILEMPDTSLRLCALISIRKFGVMGAPMVPRLVRLLSDPEPSIRRGTAEALRHMGSGAKAAAAALFSATKDTDEQVAQAATKALQNLNLTTVEIGLLQAHEQASSSTLQSSITTLTTIVTSTTFSPAAAEKKILLDIKNKFKSKDLAVRQQAVQLVLPLGSAEAQLLLLEMLKEKNTELKMQVVEALSKRPGLADKSVPALLEIILSSSASHGLPLEKLVLAVISIAPQPLKLDLYLKRGFAHKDSRVRASTALLVSGLDGDRTNYFPMLVSGLGDQDRRVRFFSASALRSIGNAPKFVTDKLKVLASDTDERVQAMAKAALAASGVTTPSPVPSATTATPSSAAAAIKQKLNEAQVSELVIALASAEPLLRQSAAKQLREKEWLPEPFVTQLMQLVSSDDLQVVSVVLRALNRLNLPPPGLADRVLRNLQSSDVTIRRSTILLLCKHKLGQLEDYILSLKDHDQNVRSASTLCLSELANGASEPIKVTLQRVFVALLDDESPLVRMYAAHALGELGHADVVVVDGLRRLLGDTQSGVAKSAASALEKLNASQEADQPGLVEELEPIDDPVGSTGE